MAKVGWGGTMVHRHANSGLTMKYVGLTVISEKATGPKLIGKRGEKSKQ